MKVLGWILLGLLAIAPILKGGHDGLMYIVGVAYFLPTIVAILPAQHPSSGAILVLNMLLGWTFVGWAVALVWACNGPQKPALAQNPSR